MTPQVNSNFEITPSTLAWLWGVWLALAGCDVLVTLKGMALGFAEGNVIWRGALTPGALLFWPAWLATLAVTSGIVFALRRTPWVLFVLGVGIGVRLVIMVTWMNVFFM